MRKCRHISIDLTSRVSSVTVRSYGDPTVTHQEKAEAQAVALALAYLAEAAIAWSDLRNGESSDRAAERALSSLSRASAWALRIARTDNSASPRTPAKLVGLMQTPLNQWLQVNYETPLLESDSDPTTLCWELSEQLNGRPDLELAQKNIALVRNRLREEPIAEKLKTNQELYIAFRRALCVRGYARLTDAQELCIRVGIPLAEIFERIPTSNTIKLQDKTVFYPCPRCGWPMRFRQALLSCMSRICQERGALFQRTDRQECVPLAGTAMPAPLSANDHLRVCRGIWYYTTLPGLIELELERRVVAIPGVREVTMWPEFDAYDLHVIAGESSWRVDVKDWRSTVLLAERLNQRPPSTLTFIVVPDRRKDQAKELEQRCTSSEWRFATVSQFVKIVRLTLKSTQGY